MQYTCGPLVCSVHGHVAGVTRSTTAKAEEEAVRRRSIAVTAANKYQIITSNHYLRLQKGDNNGTGEDGILSIATRMCTTADQHCLSRTTTESFVFIAECNRFTLDLTALFSARVTE